MHVEVSSMALYRLAVARRESGVNPTLWYVTRAAGVSAYVLLAIVVDLGILLSLARQLETHVSWVLDELHQFLSLLTAALVALHLGALLIDPFITFSLANLLLPLNEPYQPLGITFGVLGLYALLVLLASSWSRRFLPRRFWRGLHYLSFCRFCARYRARIACRERRWSGLDALGLLRRLRLDTFPHRYAAGAGTT